MRDYDFTLGELLDQLNAAAETLKGKNPHKEDGGLKEMVNRAVADLDIDFIFYNIEIKNCSVYIDTVDFGVVEIATFYPEYKKDKRMTYDTGSYLKNISVSLKRNDIPLDTEVLNLTQILAYDVAKEHKERLEEEIAEYEKEIAERKIELEKMKEIMRKQKYE